MERDNRLIWSVIAIVLFFLLFVMPLNGSSWGGLCGMMGGYGYNYGYGMMGGFGWIFMLLIIVALILFIIWIIQQVQDNNKKRK